MELQPEYREPAWVHAGSILRAHGVRGALRVRFDIPPSDLTQDLECVRVVPRRGEPRVMHVQEVRPIHDAALLVLKEVESREAAQLLAGASIELPEALLPQLSADNAYAYELVEAQVQAQGGEPLGVVRSVADNAGQALLVIHSAEHGERLLPLVEATFRSFDRNARLLTVNVPEGLWDE